MTSNQFLGLNQHRFMDKLTKNVEFPVIFLSLQISEERLGHVLKETQQQYELEISKMQGMSCTLILCY